MRTGRVGGCESKVPCGQVELEDMIVKMKTLCIMLDILYTICHGWENFVNYLLFFFLYTRRLLTVAKTKIL